MRKKSLILCALICIAGVFGAFIRWLQIGSAFEPETGLAIPGALWSTVMLVFLIAGAAAFLLVARRWTAKNKLEEGVGYPEVFAGGSGSFMTITAIIAMALVTGGGVLSAVAAMREASATGLKLDLLNVIGGGAAIAAGICLFAVLRGISSPKRRSGAGAFIVIVLYLCLRLVAEYRAGASNPVIWVFAINILSISATLLAYYYFAGYSFARPKPTRALYFSMLAIFLSIPTLADDLPLGYQMITAGFLLGQILLMFSFAEQLTVDK